MKNIQTHKISIPNIPSWLVVSQSICFTVLYAVWMLPKTIFVRNICLVIGALLAIIVIFRYRHELISKYVLPLYLLAILYFWLIFHLFYFSTDYQAQYKELFSVWKNSFIAVTFGLGYGISLASIINLSDDSRNISKLPSRISYVVWILIWIGLLAPELIFIIKWILTKYQTLLNIDVPDYLKLWPESSEYYVAKVDYVAFCLPALAMALGQLRINICNKIIISYENIYYLFVIASVLFVFTKWRVLNGIIYSTVCFIFFASMLNTYSKNIILLRDKLILILIFILISTSLTYQVIHHPNVNSLLNDVRVSFNVKNLEEIECCKNNNDIQSEDTNKVNISNYRRITWFINGIELIWNYPLGYGLLQNSFGRLMQIHYQNSKLDQSHSGWVDLTLGIGLIGTGLIIMAILITMRNLSILSNGTRGHLQITNLGWWAIFSTCLAWITSELSQKIYIELLLFWITLSVGITIGIETRRKNKF